MLGWVILVTTLFFLLYVTTMSFKVNNSSTNSTLVTSVIAFVENSCVMTLSKKCKGELFLFWFGEEKYFSLILSMTELFHLLHITIKYYYKLLCLSCPHCQSSYYT